MRKKISKTLTAGALVAGFASLTASAQLATLDYPGNGDPNGGPPYEPTINYASSVSANYALGSGLKLSTNGFYHGYITGIGPSQNYTFPATLAGAQSLGVYYGVTIAPKSGNVLDLTSFNLSNTAFFSGDNATGSFALESSVTGTTVLATYSQRETGADVPLGSAFQDLTGPVTFEIYPYGIAGGYGTASLQGPPSDVNSGSLSINGTSLAPEPSSYALIGLGIISLALLSRLRRNYQV